jgi:hypothetical protein
MVALHADPGRDYMTAFSPWSGALLTAAIELSAVTSDDADASQPCKLWCLHALEELALAGAVPSVGTATFGLSSEDRLRLALRTIAELPPEVYAHQHVIDAAASVRRALQLVR